MSTTTSNLGLFKYDVNTDTNVAFSITKALNNNWDIIDEKCGRGGLEVCDIGMALYIDETKGLRRYLNGQVVDINTNTQVFLDRLKQITTLHPSLLCTEEEWQTAKTMSAFGQVGKFVFNYADDGITIESVRIPAIVNIQGLFDLQNLGMTVSAGLPNITGSFNKAVNYINNGNNGCFAVSKNSGRWGGNEFNWYDLYFDASRSSSIYGNSDTVQPEAIQYPYFIQIATGSETENNIINEIELNNPYSLFDSKYSPHELNNLSWLKSEGQWNAKAVYPTAYDKLLKIYNGTETVEGLSVKLSTETSTDYDFVLNTAGETFRLPLKTKLASGKSVVGNGMAIGMTNGTINTGLTYGSQAQGLLATTGAYNINIGQTTSDSTQPYGVLQAIGITPDPTKSGMVLSDSDLYLYFYVGETVQNANLIDAGRIGEQLANLTNVVETYKNGTSWYRVYSDGWCEQGGFMGGIATNSWIFVTLLKPYINTDYTVIGSGVDPSISTTYPDQFFSYRSPLQTTGFYGGIRILSGGATYADRGFSWIACGYIR